MMKTTRTLAALLLLTLLATTAAAAGGGLSDTEVELCRPGDMRKVGQTLYYWTLEDRFTGNESYRVLCEPVGDGACEGGWKPVSVTMYLYWEESNTCSFTVQAEIHSSDSANPMGPHSGRLIAASEPTTVGPFRPQGLWAVTVPIPKDAPAIDGPCFASLRFLDTCSELPQMVAAPGSCDPNRSWVDRGAGWEDMHGLELPGNLSAYATFECQGRGAEEEVAWGTIKGMYGKDE